MKEAAVIGKPVSHSRSPAIFEFLAQNLNVSDLRYRAIPVEATDLSSFFADLRKQPGWIGLNVTLPHKVAIRRELDAISLEATAVGAVNVVEIRSGKFTGHNTDVFGVIRTLEEHRCAIRGQSAWIYGAGGAARAVAYALGKMEASQVVIANRTLSHAEKIADEIGSLFPSTKYQAVVEGGDVPPLATPLSLVVNSTPIGMRGYSGDKYVFSSLSALPFRRDAFAFDLIYDPETTPFHCLARDLGLKTIGGLDMLIYQALATWEIWAPSLIENSEIFSLKGRLAEHLKGLQKSPVAEFRPIFLTGFMGVGKSTVGALLAKQLGYPFVDTDELVMAAAGKSIPEIFSESGEAGFRALESMAVKKVCGMSRVIVALGGGALLNASSLDLVKDAGNLVFLGAAVESLQKRLETSAHLRPLLAGLGVSEQKEKIRTLLDAREAIYRGARYQIETDGITPDDVASKILAAIRKEDA